MGSRRSRLVTILVALAVLAALGTWWRRSATSVRSDETTGSPSVPNVPPRPVDLQPGPSRRKHVDHETRVDPGARSADGTVVRRVHVRLPDGRDAPSGTVLWVQIDAAGSGMPAETEWIDSSPIGPGGVAELGGTLGEGSSGAIVVSVPGWPNEVRFELAGSVLPTTEFQVPEGIFVRGRVVDRDGRGVGDLAILLTSGMVSPYAVFDEDLDLALHVVGRRGVHVTHVEGVTDASGQFRIRAPRPKWIARWQVASRDDRWFVKNPSLDGPLYLIDDAMSEILIEDGVAVPGVAIDLRVNERGGDPTERANLWFETTDADSHPWGFGVDLRHATTRVRIPRFVADGPVFATIVVSAPGFAPAIARATVASGLVESRVDLTLDRADDESRTGLAELTIPVEGGVAGEETPWPLEMQTPDEPKVRVQIFDTTRWAAPGRIDVRLPPGAWTLRLLSPERDRIQFQADVSIAARVTTRVPMR